MNKQRGFTLIELVVVIIILGVLAAVAVPRFVDMSTSARNAAARGVAGAISSGSSLNYAQRQTTPATAIVVNDATNVCTVAILSQFVQGGIQLVAATPATPSDNVFVVGGTGQACGGAQVSGTCTIAPSTTGAATQDTIVYCAR